LQESETLHDAGAITDAECATKLREIQKEL